MKSEFLWKAGADKVAYLFVIILVVGIIILRHMNKNLNESKQSYYARLFAWYQQLINDGYRVIAVRSSMREFSFYYAKVKHLDNTHIDAPPIEAKKIVVDLTSGGFGVSHEAALVVVHENLFDMWDYYEFK